VSSTQLRSASVGDISDVHAFNTTGQVPPRPARKAGVRSLSPSTAPGTDISFSGVGDGQILVADKSDSAIASLETAWQIVWRTESDCGANLEPGDGGNAHGHAQYHKARWNEACRKLGLDYAYPDDCYNAAKVREVTIGIWKLERPGEVAAGDVESLVRRHRLPYAPYRADNDEYWRYASEKYRKWKGE